MLTSELSRDWWRPEPVVMPASAAVPDTDLAFKALVAFTAILLLAPQEWFPVLKSLRIALLAATVSFVAYMFDSAVQRRPISTFSTEMGICVALVVWSILTIPLSYWPGGSVTELTEHFLKAVMFFWLIGTLVITMKRLMIFTWTLVLCSIPLAATGVQNFLSGEFVTSRRAEVQRIAGYAGSGIASNPNDLALMLNLLIPIAGALLIMTKKAPMKAAAAFTMMLSLATVVITFSRAGFIALIVIILLGFVALIRRRLPGAAVAIVLVALVVPPMLPPGYRDRLNTITDIESDRTGSAQGRWEDFGAAVDVVIKNPITGVGLGQDILALNEERGRTWRSVHNVYLQYAVDLGIPGAVLFIWLLVATFRGAKRVRVRAASEPHLRDLTVLAGGVQIALVAFAVESFFHPVAYQFYFFCIGGLAVALQNTCRTELAMMRLRSEEPLRLAGARPGQAGEAAA
jgi:probable O-glycosylation ligase (exosortase A-associated)